MKRLSRCLLSCLVLVLATAAPALAKKNQQPGNIDFGAVTCKEFVREIAGADDESAGMILLWLDGYLSGVSGDTTLKWEPLEKFSEALMSTCAQKPGAKVLDVAKQVGIN
jgi:acid stress chaperone HdeB